MIDQTPVYLLLIIGFLATEPWRWLGVFFSNGLDEESEIIKWVRAVSTALIAALVMRFIIAPPGLLAETPLTHRMVAMVIATITYHLFGKRLLMAIISGLVGFILITLLAPG